MIESKPPAEAPASAFNAAPGELPRTYTYADVAGVMKVSVQTVMEWVKRGKCPSPNYLGSTARFTSEHVAQIVAGVQPAGTFAVATSPRAAVGLHGANVKKKKNKKATAKGKPGRPKTKLVANTPAAKKIAARKKVAKAPKAVTTKVLK